MSKKYFILILLVAVSTLIINNSKNSSSKNSKKYTTSGVYKKYSINPIGDFSKMGSHLKTIGDLSVLNIDGKYHLWFSCNDGEKSEVCYANSVDGIKWTPNAKSVFKAGRKGLWDDYNSEVPTVIKDGAIFKMWYTGYSHAVPNIYKNIGYATSPDGVNWTRLPAKQSPYNKEGVVLVMEEKKDEFYSISDPMVLKVKDIYHMWYNAYVYKPFNMIAIYHATSSDGINWKRDPLNPVIRPSKAWEMVGNEGTVVQPAVIWDGERFEIWYGSFSDELMRYSAISHAVSTDGSVWAKDNAPAILPGPEDLWPSVSALKVGNETRIYYIGFPELGKPPQIYLSIGNLKK